MSRFVIFGAGEMTRNLYTPMEGDFLLAADGGLRHLKAFGLVPQGILGDFDSLGYVPEGAEVFPVEKDDTDSMLAARQGLKMGYTEFLFFGCMDGKRLDHTLANLQTLLFLKHRGAQAVLVGETYTATAVSGERLVFSPGFSGILSLFCMGKPAKGMTIRGMKYELTGGELTPDFPLGVSNHFLGKEAEVAVPEGDVIALWDTDNGFCERRPC